MDHVPYILNIVILLPAIVLVLQGKIDVFPQQGDMAVLRLMVASLWVGVLFVSAIALLDPVQFWPVLVFQLIYNVIFGALWVYPSIRNPGRARVPWGAAAVFVFMVVTWPYFIYAALNTGQG